MIRLCYFCLMFNLIVLIAGGAKADVVQYEFTGVLPDGSSSHSEIDDGETWRAVFSVDRFPEGQQVDANLAAYGENVVDGFIEFSGGYTREIFAPFGIVVANDSERPASGTFVDAIAIWSPGDSLSDFVVQAQVESLVPVDVLNDVSLPAVGTSFTSSSVGMSFFQLRLVDGDLGTVEYGSLLDSNVSFRVIPEPAMALVVGVALPGLICFRRKRL